MAPSAKQAEKSAESAQTWSLTSPLGQQDRQATGQALQNTLLELIDLHLVAKQAHWNAVGRFFRDVHLQLDELVTTARGFADDVAERAAAIGFSPDARAVTVTGGSDLPALEADWMDDRRIIEMMVSCLETMSRQLRTRIDETDRTDQVSQDLLISICSKLEEAHWMWQAQLASS